MQKLPGFVVVAFGVTAATAYGQFQLSLENADLTADDRLGVGVATCIKDARLGGSFGGLGVDLRFVPPASGEGAPLIVASGVPQFGADFLSTSCCFAPYVRTFQTGPAGCAPSGAPYGLTGDGLWEKEGSQYGLGLFGSSIPSSEFGASLDLRMTSGNQDAYLLVGSPGAWVNAPACTLCSMPVSSADPLTGAGKVRILDARTGVDLVTGLLGSIDPIMDECGETIDTLGWRPEVYCFPPDSIPPMTRRPVAESFGSVVRWAHTAANGDEYFIVFAPQGLDETETSTVGRFYVARFRPSTGNVELQYIRYGGADATPGTPAIGEVKADWIVDDFDGDGKYEVVVLQLANTGSANERRLFVAQYDPAEPAALGACAGGSTIFDDPQAWFANTVTASWVERGTGFTNTVAVNLAGTEMTNLELPGRFNGGGAAIERVGDVDCDGTQDFVIGLGLEVDFITDPASDPDGTLGKYYVVGIVLSLDAMGDPVGKTALAIPMDRPAEFPGYVSSLTRAGTRRSVSAIADVDSTIREVLMGFGEGSPLVGAFEDSAIRIKYEKRVRTTSLSASMQRSSTCAMATSRGSSSRKTSSRPLPRCPLGDRRIVPERSVGASEWVT